jgi:hypothetical protein
MTILLEPLNNYIVVCIASHETFDVRRNTQTFSRKVQLIIDGNNTLLSSGQIPIDLEDKINSIINDIYLVN